MAIGALQTGYTTLYGKIAGLGTKNGQTRGSSFREHIDGTEKKAPYQHLAQNGTITYKGVTFVCDTDRNRITLGDVTDRSKCLNISLKGGGCLMVNRGRGNRVHSSGPTWKLLQNAGIENPGAAPESSPEFPTG
jgi:hypothetical protein